MQSTSPHRNRPEVSEEHIYMIIYHAKALQSRRQIFSRGFADGVGTYLTVGEHSGVWFSNVPLDSKLGIVVPPTLLAIADEVIE